MNRTTTVTFDNRARTETRACSAARVLILSRYGRSGASSRVRFYQYLSSLVADGLQVTSQALLDDQYLARLYAGQRRSALALVRQYWNRLQAVLAAGNFDLVWLEKECWPWAPTFLDPALLASRVRYVVDYDDAIFHNYDQSRSAVIRAVFGGKIDSVMQRSALVLAGNDYLADRARKAGARWIEIVPSVVDLQRYTLASHSRQSCGFVVGWIGTPATQHLIEPLVPILSKVLDSPDDKFVTIGGRFRSPLFANHQMRPWSEEREVAEISSFDVGIMPLPDRAFEQGKCGYKLIQYMALSKPVIASPVGANREIVEHQVNGFLAATTQEWVDALSSLRQSRVLCAEMGAAGRKSVEERYSLQVTAPRIVALLRQVIDAQGCDRCG
jgi:glycosyltransferase involved in cell wall biosynthesis